MIIWLIIKCCLTLIVLQEMFCIMDCKEIDCIEMVLIVRKRLTMKESRRVKRSEAQMLKQNPKLHLRSLLPQKILQLLQFLQPQSAQQFMSLQLFKKQPKLWLWHPPMLKQQFDQDARCYNDGIQQTNKDWLKIVRKRLFWECSKKKECLIEGEQNEMDSLFKEEQHQCFKCSKEVNAWFEGEQKWNTLQRKTLQPTNASAPKCSFLNPQNPSYLSQPRFQ